MAIFSIYFLMGHGFYRHTNLNDPKHSHDLVSLCVWMKHPCKKTPPILQTIRCVWDVIFRWCVIKNWQCDCLMIVKYYDIVILLLVRNLCKICGTCMVESQPFQLDGGTLYARVSWKNWMRALHSEKVSPHRFTIHIEHWIDFPRFTRQIIMNFMRNTTPSDAMRSIHYSIFIAKSSRTSSHPCSHSFSQHPVL